MKSKFLKGVLGELLAERVMPPKENIGALSNIGQNENIKNIMPSQKELETTEEAIKMIGLADRNPFELFEDQEGYEFVNRTLLSELSKATKLNNYEDARRYMFEIQENFQDFGALDTEANNFIDSVLEEVFGDIR